MITVLSEFLLPAEAGLVLGCIALARWMAAALALLPAPRGFSGQDRVGMVLLWWLGICGTSLVAVRFTLVPLFEGAGLAVICLSGLTLLLTMKTFMCGLLPSRRGFSGLIPLTEAMPAGIILALSHLGPLTADAALAALVLWYLFVVLILCLKVPVTRTGHATSPGRGLCQGVDVLLVVLLCGGDAVFDYLIALSLVQFLPVTLHHLAGRAAPALQAAFRSDMRGSFAAASARLNLGSLLIGGAVSLLALTAAPLLHDALGQAWQDGRVLFLWLLLGAAAPLLFGMVEPLMQAAGRTRLVRLLNIFGSLLCVVAVLAHPDPDVVMIAQTWALRQLAVAAVSALILARDAGVWPGLTALLLRRIRLF